MTKIFDSYRVMYGRNNFLKLFSVGMIGIAIMLTGGLIKGFVGEESFLCGFISGFCPSFCGIINIFTSETIVMGAFSSVRKISPGYKYFHSISDGSSHFKRSLILANLAGILLTALYIAVGLIFFRERVVLLLYIIFAELSVIGWCDLLGGSRYKWLAIVGFVLTGFIFGVLSWLQGILSFRLFMFIAAAVISACAAFYIICFISALKRAKKLWEREG